MEHMEHNVTIGVLGGSGLYNIPEITDVERVDIDTPFGKPSAPPLLGTLYGKRVAFIPRHGEGHIYTPTTVPYAANIYALKALGVRFIIGVSACGSLQEAYAPGHIAVPDQLYDNTREPRQRTFFSTGLVGHVPVADPFDDYLRGLLVMGVQEAGGTAHDGGLFITVEGPRFSTKGESKLFRSWGCDIIGMTTSPEAFLAAEAEIAYAVMAHITDYDVWHETEAAVNVEMVFATAKHNVEVSRRALAHVIANLDDTAERPAHSTLALALTTHKEAITPEMREKLDLLMGKYLD
jgi:5'-methylthioadenosine phosphorylase